MEPVEPEPERKAPPRLRWLRRLGCALFALAIVLFLLALLPSRHSNPEPRWLAKLPVASSTESIAENTLYTATPTRVDIFAEERVRYVEMPVEDFIRRMNEDLKKEEGWDYHRPQNGSSASWNRSGKEWSDTIWIMIEGGRVRVSTSRMHVLSWPEKAWLRFKRAFGFKVGK